MNFLKLFLLFFCFSFMNKALTAEQGDESPDYLGGQGVDSPIHFSNGNLKYIQVGDPDNREQPREETKSNRHCLWYKNPYCIYICLSSFLALGLGVSLLVLSANGDCCNTTSI